MVQKDTFLVVSMRFQYIKMGIVGLLSLIFNGRVYVQKKAEILTFFLVNFT